MYAPQKRKFVILLTAACCRLGTFFSHKAGHFAFISSAAWLLSCSLQYNSIYYYCCAELRGNRFYEYPARVMSVVLEFGLLWRRFHRTQVGFRFFSRVPLWAAARLCAVGSIIVVQSVYYDVGSQIVMFLRHIWRCAFNFGCDIYYVAGKSFGSSVAARYVAPSPCSSVKNKPGTIPSRAERGGNMTLYPRTTNTLSILLERPV